MENIKKIAVLLLVVNIAVVIYFGQSILKEIRELKDTQSSQYVNLTHQVINQGNHLLGSIENLINNSINPIDGFKHSVLNMDPAEKRGDVEFELVINESSPNSKLIGELKELGGTNSVQVEFERLEGLTYRSIVYLALDKNYEVDIYEKTNDGATKKLNISDMAVHLYNEIYAERIQGLGSGTSSTADELEYRYSFRTTRELVEGTEIAQVIIEARDDQQNVIQEFTSEASTGSVYSAELEDKYKVALAAGYIDPIMTFGEYAAQYGEEVGESDQPYEIYYVAKTFTKDELSEHWEMFRNGSYTFTIKVIFEDGIEISL